MNALLDTCLVSELIKPKPDARVLAWMARTPEESCFLSVVTLGELERGIARLAAGTRRARLENWLGGLVEHYDGRTVGIDAGIARRWGKLSGQLAKRGRAISMGDGLIAASAIEHGLAVATRNVVDFALTGAKLIDPWKG